LINCSEKRTSCSPSSPRWLLNFGREETYENAEMLKTEMLEWDYGPRITRPFETLKC
jgi:hypothetical protein